MSENPQTLPPLALAFIGDAIMSLKVREYVLEKGYHRPNDFQHYTVKYVSAKAQSAFILKFMEDGILSEEEINVYKRGRNAKSLTTPKNTDVVTYRNSTGFEALWGYLHLMGRDDRIDEMFEMIKEIVQI